MNDKTQAFELNSNDEENDQVKQRHIKLAELRSRGQAYPNDFRFSDWALDLHKNYADKDAETLAMYPVSVKLAGRIMTRRLMGKASFVNIQDMTGQIQLYVRQDDLPDGVYEQFKSWDLGDIVGAHGIVFKTKTGELSVKVNDIRLLTKALRPLPEKFHGLADQETCYRQRYLDLLVNPESRRNFQIRSALISGIRKFLIERQFMEVETPMLQKIPGGALARPFVTHHNTLDMTLYLRIAPELALKQLVVGGFERVFEINRNFRNEGMSTRHNPEFTTLEFYQAYADYQDLMDLTETLLHTLTRDILDSPIITFQGTECDFSKTFARFTMREAILHFNPDIKSTDLDDINIARRIAEQYGVNLQPTYGLGKVWTEIFEKTVEKKLLQPTFITSHPAEVSPLARKNDQNPFVVDRFEFYVGGQEIANGFSELNDPEDQAERFRKQVEELASGDQEAMHYDADYITALEYGLPPTAGEGIGIDRLAMLFTNSASIRDVILFPLLRIKD
ncbi:MAG: lysine--tRNA ligase [Gammaproteobacteria bacterium GWE2_37_16]|nr:MAG: lysine--tRNA ligase [Gammaproteobacteria bacterium GWE2_37_16]